MAAPQNDGQDPASQNTEQSKKTKRLLIAGLAAALALTVTGFGIGAYKFFNSSDGEVEASANGDGSRATIDATEAAMVNGYEFLPTIEDHEASEPFTIELTNNAREDIDDDWEPGMDMSYFADVYVDPGLTRHASMSATTTVAGLQMLPAEDVEAVPGVFDGVEDTFDSVPRIKSTGGDSWGQYETYYVVQYLDKRGDELETPTVQPYQIKQDSLDEVDFVISSEDEDGNVKFTWEEVEGASEYLIVSGHYQKETTSRKYQIAGKTSDTSWSSSESVNTIGDGVDDVVTQNQGLAMYKTHADELLEKPDKFDLENEGITEFEIGIIATDGKRFSPYAPKNAASLLGSLPSVMAWNTWDDRFPDSLVLDSLDDLKSTRMPYVSLDGNVRETAMKIDPSEIETATVHTAETDDDGDVIDDTETEKEVLRVPVHGIGTMHAYRFTVDADMDEIKQQVEEFNQRSIKDSPRTGNKVIGSDDAVAQAGFDVDPATDFADVPYPVHGSSEFVEYLASNMLAHRSVIDISEFAGKPGMAEPYDALAEAYWQNPFIVGEATWQVRGDHAVINYQYDEDEFKGFQEELAKESESVVAAIIEDGMSERERATAVNGWVVEQGEYDHEALEAIETNESTAEYSSASDARGIMLEGEGVCASYAHTYSLLADAADLEAIVVTGDIDDDGAGHAWNKVNVDGDWLAVDPTWNDSDANPNQYLLINDDEFVDDASRTENSEWMSDISIGEYATP